MNRILAIALAVTMALWTAPPALSATDNPLAEDEGWRGTYYNHNEEPNVDGIYEDTTGDGVDDTLTYAYDKDSSKMFQGPNQEKANKIYLDQRVNVNEGPSILTPITHVPKPNADGSAFRSQGFTDYSAYLGFWRDCNGDGYVGSAVTGGHWYSIDQLREESALNGFDWTEVCPLPDQGDDADYMYNDGKQVRELIPIGPQARDAETGSSLQESHTEPLVCPDKDGGPSGEEVQGGAQRSGTSRTSEDDALLNNGGNAACVHGGSEFFVQDDYAKVGFHLGIAHDPAKPTSSIVPPPDGITTDSNGFFWYVDNQNLGKASEEFPGLWPTKRDHDSNQHSQYQDNDWDPREPNQCEPHNDPTASSGGATGVAAADNVATFADENGDPTDYPGRTQAWVQDHEDLRKSRDTALVTCSPVPNMQYIDVDNDQSTAADRFAWPLHIAEDRVSNEESTDEEPNAIADPWQCSEGQPGGAQGSGVNGDVSAWDGEDDADPIADDSQPWKYYGPNHDGPSLWPAVAGGLNVLLAHALDDSCRDDNGGFGLVETYSAGGAGGNKRTAMPYEMFFNSGTCVNPAKSPGISEADTAVCHNPLGNAQETTAGHRLEYAYWDGVAFIDVPNEPPDFWAGRTINSTVYADVSFGAPAENDDGSCDFPFDPAGTDGFNSEGACFPQASDPTADGDSDGEADGDNRGGVYDSGAIPVNPSAQLPGGADNAHQFGDEQCGGTTAPAVTDMNLAAGGNDEYVDGVVDGQNQWSCERQVWIDAENRDCALQNDDPNPTAELGCYLNFKVGDPYDLWDTECADNDLPSYTVAGERVPPNTDPGRDDDFDTTDVSGTDLIGNRDCDDLDEQSIGDPNGKTD